MQLVAYGAQDIYLTGNPMITYFKVVYRRHTNFAMESIEQTFNGNPDFGQRVSCLISRNGDLVSGLTLEATLPNQAAARRYTDRVGHYLLQEVSVEIGGQQIDKHYGDWLEIWSQLSVPAGKQAGYAALIGQDAKDSIGQPTGLQSLDGATAGRKVYVPLQFWFCRNVGLALPLIALQYHEVKVNITFAALSTLGCAAASAASGAMTGALSNVALWADYVYLDTDERRRFAQVSHEYLIEQLQFSGDQATAGAGGEQSFNMHFNHPIKELVWVVRQDANTTDNQLCNYTSAQAVLQNTVTDLRTITGVGPATLAAATSNQDMVSVGGNMVDTNGSKIRLNGHDRFAAREGDYFNKVQTLACHTNVPASPGINVYSFALKPEDHQPSGTCNFSRIDNAQLVLGLNAGVGVAPNQSAGTLKVFAVNYNVLRIMSGMGGLAYSN